MFILDEITKLHKMQLDKLTTVLYNQKTGKVQLEQRFPSTRPINSIVSKQEDTIKRGKMVKLANLSKEYSPKLALRILNEIKSSFFPERA